MTESRPTPLVMKETSPGVSGEDFGQKPADISLKNQKSVQLVQPKTVDRSVYSQDEDVKNCDGLLKSLEPYEKSDDFVDGGTVIKDPAGNCLKLIFNSGATDEKGGETNSSTKQQNVTREKCSQTSISNGLELEFSQQDGLPGEIKDPKPPKKATEKSDSDDKPEHRINISPLPSQNHDGLPGGDHHAKNTKPAHVNKSDDAISELETLLRESEFSQQDGLPGEIEDPKPPKKATEKSDSDDKSEYRINISPLPSQNHVSLKESIVAYWQRLSKREKIVTVVIIVGAFLLACGVGVAVYFIHNKHQSDQQICENMTTIKVDDYEHFGNDYQNCTSTLEKKNQSENEFWSCVPQKKNNSCDWFLTKTRKDPYKQSCRDCCPIVTFETIDGAVIKFAPLNSSLQCVQKGEICEAVAHINIEDHKDFGTSYHNCILEKKSKIGSYWSCVPDQKCNWWLTKTTKDPDKRNRRDCCPIVTFEIIDGAVIKFAPHDLLQCIQREEKTAVHCFSYL